ncbi:hypothetical protein [Cryobacterium frigoriphilum]|uniref:hypothetical protein n=1 Tax=Cryobacterium frigoriphilum TaxID=1259150 RepID=UPI001F543814|nr:hypothetical protein [Cryobacterium frigoriphilum]
MSGAMSGASPTASGAHSGRDAAPNRPTGVEKQQPGAERHEPGLVGAVDRVVDVSHEGHRVPETALDLLGQHHLDVGIAVVVALKDEAAVAA